MTEPIFSTVLQDYHERSLARVREHLPGVAQALRAAGITVMRVHYDGCGDSGQLEEPQLFENEQDAVPLERLDLVHRQQLIQLLYDLLEVRHGGWENNDGAVGYFTWTLKTDDLIHVHHDRYTEYHTTEHHGL